MVALMPVTLMAPLLPPLKEPEIVGLGEVLVDEPDPLEGGVEDLLMEELGMVEDRVPVPEEVEEGKEELEEMRSAISNVEVSESVVVTSPTGEAWKVYPGPDGTTGRTTVTVPSAVVTMFLNAKLLRKLALVR